MNRRGMIAAGLAAALTLMAPHARAQSNPDRPELLQLETLSVPVILTGQPLAQLNIAVQLELASADMSIEARRMMSRLVNDLLVGLADVVARTPATAAGPDVERIRRRIFTVSTRVLGPGSVKAVHLQGQSVHHPR